MRYRYFTDANMNVICVSTFAGKTVRGVAHCNMDYDDFDEECGKKLSRARCDYKIAFKRVRRANEKVTAAREALMKAQEAYNRMLDYQEGAMQEFEFARDQLEEIETNLQ